MEAIMNLLLRTAFILLLPLLASCGGGGGDGGGGGSRITTYTISTDGDVNGSITPPGKTVAHNDTASFTVTPDTNYNIADVSGCGGMLVGDIYTTGPVIEACTVNVDFIQSHTVNTNVAGSGTISPLTVSVNEGGITHFTVTPDIGFSIASVSGCGGTLDDTTYTTGPISANCTVSTLFIPSLSIADASVTEGDSGTSNLIFTISLIEVVNGDVTVDYEISNGTAMAGSDYTSSGGSLTITSGTTSSTLTVLVNGDTTQENHETLTVTLSNYSANVTLSDHSAIGRIIDDDGAVSKPISDTGIVWGGNYPGGNNNTCIGETIGQQDCSNGRDATASSDSDGHAGFSFTKLDSSGSALPAVATTWFCVKDNVTGLIWEVKQGGNGIYGDDGLHDSDDEYNWYDTDPTTNGGADGYADDDGAACAGYTPGIPSTYCNMQAYTARVNAIGLCGATDWRMPTVVELSGLVNFNRSSTAIDQLYFPNTRGSHYWSSSPAGGDSELAWYVNFYDGNAYYLKRSNVNYVRLVRSG